MQNNPSTKKTKKKQWLIIALCAVILIGGVLALIILRNSSSPVSNPPEVTEVPTASERDQYLPEEPIINGETYPTVLSNGQSFGLRGTIVCKYIITEIRATVTNRVTGEVIFDIPVQPNATSYAIGNPTSETINDSLVFNSPECSNSWLNYKVDVAYDKNSEICHKAVLDQNFKVGNPTANPPEE